MQAVAGVAPGLQSRSMAVARDSARLISSTVFEPGPKWQVRDTAVAWDEWDRASRIHF
jgi:hypothetical protein